MLRILHDTKYDFIRWWRTAVIITAVFIAAGIGSLVIKGIPYSIEFTGGTMIQFTFKTAPDAAKLRAGLDADGITGAEIQQYGSPTSYTVRVQTDSGDVAIEAKKEKVKESVARIVGAENVTVGFASTVGPRVGAELRRGAIIAIFISFGITLLYLAWRFEWRFGLAAVIATAHDILTTLAFLKLMHLEVSLTVIAALLTVLGYSLNDTIIIFDRVRENLRQHKKETLYELLNRSVNETLPRSILTHATALGATLALLFFAGEVIRPFAWVMAFGIFTGTFSSIYVASPILLWIEQKYPRAVEGKK
jgi:preprotein translocase subunit SecF